MSLLDKLEHLLNRRENRFRAGVAQQAFKTGEIDAQGGDYGVGLIRNIIVCRPGEALGHGFSVDKQFCQDVSAQLNGFASGCKCRFGHPGMCDERLGGELGVYKNAHIDEDGTVRADLHLLESSFISPKGNMGAWVLKMAQERPDMIMSSICFYSESYFYIDDEGNQVKCNPPSMGWGEEDTKTTAPEGKDVFAKLKKLTGCDLVDQGALTDNMFSEGPMADELPAAAARLFKSHTDLAPFVRKHADELVTVFSHPKLLKSYLSRLEAEMNVAKQETASPAPIPMAQAKPYSFLVTTDQGPTLRIESDMNSPQVGDAVFQVDGDTETPAPDGDYTVSEGDFSGLAITVAGGTISTTTAAEVPPPADPGAADLSNAELSAKVDILTQQLSKVTADLKKLASNAPRPFTPGGQDLNSDQKLSEPEKFDEFTEALIERRKAREGKN